MEQRTYMRTSLALLAALSLVVGLSWTPLTAHAGKPIPERLVVSLKPKSVFAWYHACWLAPGRFASSWLLP